MLLVVPLFLGVSGAGELRTSSQEVVTRLAAALEAGPGRAETEAIAIRVRGFVGNVRQHGSRVPQTLQTEAVLARAEELLQQLAPDYFPEAG